MPNPRVSQLRSLLKFETLLKMAETSATKEDVINIFKKLAGMVETIEKRNLEEMERMQKMYQNLTDKLQNMAMGNHTSLVEKTNAEMEKLNDKMMSKMMDIDEKVAGLKDGKDADEELIVEEVLDRIDIPAGELRDKLEGLKDEDRLNIEAIKGCEEEHKKLMDKIEETKKSMVGTRMGRFFGGTPHNLLQTIDVSSQINGTNREFTSLPVARFYPFAFSSQSPFILLPNTHYTIGRNSITIGNNLEPPQSGTGAYMFIAYIK